MKNTLSIAVSIYLLFSFSLQAQIPSNIVVENSELPNYLKPEIKNKLAISGKITEATLAAYFREKFSERYFYDWQLFEARFKEYNILYDPKSEHEAGAFDHMQKFADSTYWLLPFSYLNGDPVNAYALRHLARSHKMIDIAFQYYYDNKDPEYIRYFVNQMGSLNVALANGAYEKIEDGNGVYEVFRSGYRILNWLRVHNMFLSQEAYNDSDQLTLIATMLQHGQDLYEQNENFQPGNHQTRGMSALAMLAILFNDFEGTDLWYERSMSILEEHLRREINADGFQFERSVHYHISDIGNYFYVYQLAQINNYDVSEAWEERLRSLFTTLTEIAYPDKSAPVLQDDTDHPWAEKNHISGTLTLGYLLFEDPNYGYFATDKVEKSVYWFLNNEQLNMLENIKGQVPAIGSTSFNDTGYYIMREGWDNDNRMLIISAGLDDKKPDHQHGDMLGIQAMANGNVLLPNYQVRYSLPDYEFFKNSMVKNIALVDDIMQGRKYQGNKGGSGFGKFGYLPNPKTILWQPTMGLEWYIGSHDGFEEAGVSYSRQVFAASNDFWIVKDNFDSEQVHDYKQVWQGHYSIDEDPILIRSSFDDGTGLDIYQMFEPDKIIQDGTRGKGWTVQTKENQTHFSFITILYPFSSYNNCLNPSTKNFKIQGWILDNPEIDVQGINLRTISKAGKHYLFNAEEIEIGNQVFSFSTPSDLYFNEVDGELYLLEDSPETVKVSGKKKFKINNEIIKSSATMNPGDVLTTLTK